MDQELLGWLLAAGVPLVVFGLIVAAVARRFVRRDAGARRRGPHLSTTAAAASTIMMLGADGSFAGAHDDVSATCGGDGSCGGGGGSGDSGGGCGGGSGCGGGGCGS